MKYFYVCFIILLVVNGMSEMLSFIYPFEIQWRQMKMGCKVRGSIDFSLIQFNLCF